jgi:hypothetical protein
MVLVASAVIVIGIVTGTMTGTKDGLVVHHPTPAPVPAGSVDQGRLDAFRAELVASGYLNDYVLLADFTPQHKAWKWIATADPIRMDPTHNFMLQRYALATLFFATSEVKSLEAGQEITHSVWVEETNWMQGTGYCNWYGVECATQDGEDNADVVAINITANNMRGELPEQLNLLSRLDVLDLSNNKIEGELPTELGLMTTLRDLLLTKNKFSGSIPKEVGQMQTLRNLDLRCVVINSFVLCCLEKTKPSYLRLSHWLFRNTCCIIL